MLSLFSPILPLAIAEMALPLRFGSTVLSSAVFIMSYAVAPLFNLSSARRITLPSEWILLTCISLSKLAILISTPFPLLYAVILPSTSVLIDFVKSLSPGPTPVQIPPSQSPRSSPIEPLSTSIFKSALFVVLIKVFGTP